MLRLRAAPNEERGRTHRDAEFGHQEPSGGRGQLLGAADFARREDDAGCGCIPRRAQGTSTRWNWSRLHPGWAVPRHDVDDWWSASNVICEEIRQGGRIVTMSGIALAPLFL
jgi:hypothetical protein